MHDDIAAGSPEDGDDGPALPYSIDRDPDDPDAAAAVERLERAPSGEWRAAEMTEWLHAAPPPGPDSAELRDWLFCGQRKLGLHFLLVEPGGKRPAAMHPHGVHDATDSPVALAAYLDRYAERYGDLPVNVAVALEPSRLAVFDADVPGELAPLLVRLGIADVTVRSPGSSPRRVKDHDGIAYVDRAHHGGGHVWLVVPDGIEVPRVRHIRDEQADLRYGSAYVLMPPSIREPGPYEVIGAVGVLDDDTLARIADMVTPGPARGEGTRSGGRDRSVRPDDPRFADPGDTLRRSVAEWEDSTPWGDLLAPHGWDSLDRPDGCGCDVWAAPGVHDSPRSATAHDNPDDQKCNVRLHIWTDDPGPEIAAMLDEVGSNSLSKLQVYAAYRTGGDIGAAIEALGLDAEEGQPYDAGLFADPAGAEHDGDESAAGATTVPPADYDVRTLADRPESWARAAVEGCARAHAEGRSGPRGGPPANWYVVTSTQLRECGASPAEIAELVPLDAEARRQIRLDYAATLKDETAEIADRARALRAVGTLGTPAEVIGLDDFLAQADSDPEYRVDGLWPTGGRVLLSGPYKAGKSTLVGNVLASLVDGRPLLGRKVRPVTGRVVLLDTELDPRALRRWLRDQGIEHADRITVVPLRGKVAQLDLLDPRCRAGWVERLAGAEAVVLDCLRPVLDALGLDENHDAGRYLVGYDALLANLDASEGVVLTHHGHANERARGDSRLLDWADAIWTMVRDADGQRYFRAAGRDVDVPESALGYEEATRRLYLSGGDRTESRADRHVESVVELVTAHPGLPASKIETYLAEEGVGRTDARAAMKLAVSRGVVRIESGPRNARLHYPVVDGEPQPGTSDGSSDGAVEPQPGSPDIPGPTLFVDPCGGGDRSWFPHRKTVVLGPVRQFAGVRRGELAN